MAKPYHRKIEENGVANVLRYLVLGLAPSQLSVGIRLMLNFLKLSCALFNDKTGENKMARCFIMWLWMICLSIC